MKAVKSKADSITELIKQRDDIYQSIKDMSIDYTKADKAIKEIELINEKIKAIK
jgi:shikimate kinase